MQSITAVVWRYKQREISPAGVIIEMYLAGAFTRRIGNVNEILWELNVSVTTAYNLNDKAYEVIEAWRGCPLEQSYP